MVKNLIKTKKSPARIHVFIYLFFFVLSACHSSLPSSINSLTSMWETSSLTSETSLSSLTSKDTTSNHTSSYYTPEEDEFRYLGQNWNLTIQNANTYPIEANQFYVQTASNGFIKIGATDAVGFGENNHGGRMIRSFNTYYPEIGIEAVAYNGSIVNNPYFYNQEDYTKSGLYVDLEDQKVTFNLYTMAMFLEAHQDEIGPKLFMSASTNSAEYSEDKLQYDAWASAAWRLVQTKDNLTTPVSLHSFQMARWLDLYGEKHNALYIAALENDFIDENRQAMACYDRNPIEGETLICGGETDAILRTGYGLDYSLFVGNYSPVFNKIQGLTTGRYTDHTIYSHENGIDNSNSHTVPTVTGFIASLISLRQQANLPPFTSSEWKQLILRSADQIEPNYLSEINEFGTVVYIPLGRTVKVLNKEAATTCAIDGLCLN